MLLTSAAGIAAAVVLTGAPAPLVVGHVTLQAPEPRCGKAGCVTPAAHLVLRFRTVRGVVVNVRTNPRGDFRIRLAPGTYRVSTRATEDSPEAPLTPARIVVRRGTMPRIVFVYRPGSP